MSWKADALILGAVGLGGYILITKGGDWLKDLNPFKDWTLPSITLPDFPKDFTVWTKSFEESPEQKAARDATSANKTTLNQRTQEGMDIIPKGAFISPVPIGYVPYSTFVPVIPSGLEVANAVAQVRSGAVKITAVQDKFPAVSNILLTQVQGYIQPTPDVHSSLGSIGTRVVVKTAPIAKSTYTYATGGVIRV